MVSRVEVRDPAILSELENGQSSKQITDPEIIAQLEAREEIPTQGVGGITEDIKESLKSTPGAFVEAMRELPHQAYLGGKQAIRHPIRGTENILAGLLSGVKEAINLPSYASEYLGEKGVPGFKQLLPFYKKARIPETGLQKAVLGEEQPGDAFLQAIGEFLPISRVGAAAKGLKGVGKRALAAGALSAGKGEDPLQAALLSGLTEGAVKGGTTLSKFKPSRLIKSPLSAEELEKALEVTHGTKTGLGETIENPFLQQQYQNVLSKIPFSGANQAMQETAKTVTGRGYNLMDDLIENQSMEGGADIGVQLTEALKSAKNEAQKQKRANFKATNEYADTIDLKVGRDNFSLVAQETLEDMGKSPELMRETDPQLLKDLGDYAEGGVENNLKLTNIFRGKLGDKASQAFKEGDNYKYNLYKNMKDALDKDISEAIETSGDAELKEKYKADMDFYKKNIAPFEDRDIMRFTNREGDPDMIMNAFLKISNVSDRSNLLKKLQDKLPADKKNLLGYAYFSRALDDGELNPIKFRTLYKRLGEKQKKVLIPDAQMREKLKDYSTLVSKNTEPLNVMFNPKTGQRNLNIEAMHLASTLPALLGVATHGATGGLAGAAAVPLLARGLTKYLTSPAKREKIVGKMIKEKRRPQSDQMRLLNQYLRDAARAGILQQPETE